MGRPRTNPGPTQPATGHLVGTMYSLLHSALARSTAATYRRAVSLLQNFVQETFPGTPALPASNAIVANFIAYLYASGYASATIITYIAAITAVHTFFKVWPDPAHSFLVKTLLMGANRLRLRANTASFASDYAKYF